MYYQELPNSSEKKVHCYRNGNSGTNFTLKFRKNYKSHDILNEIQKNLHLAPDRSKVYRLFNQDGVEIDITELDLLNNGDKLFVSQGEDFDQISMLVEYKIVKQLGEGGYGRVMLGIHRQTAKQVAIKIVNAAKFGSAREIDMIFSETETLKSLHHPNIVKIINCFNLKGMEIAFVMEYLEGGELLELVKQKKGLPESLARTFFKQLMEAISYCHRAKMIHRDLKLENILLVSKDSDIIKVVDFGVAGLSSEIKVDIDAGSLRYIPPEILNGTNKFVNPAIDIWAMGCILFGMVCGEVPFNGITNREIIDKICRVDYSYPKEIEKKLSYEVKDLISKILVPNPAERYNIKDISCHPWIMEEKMQVIETIPEKSEETKERKVSVKDRILSVREAKSLGKIARSESLKIHAKPNNQSPVGSPSSQKNQKPNVFFRSDSVGESLSPTQSRGSRNSVLKAWTTAEQKLSHFSKK